MAIGTALAIGSGLVGAGQGIRGRRKGKQAESKANEYMQQALGQAGKQFDILDALKPAIDQFAQRGQGEFDRYQKMFGPLEDKLNDYYNNLNPDDLAAQGNQTAQQQYQNTMNQVNDQLAAQGISNSGVGAQMSMQAGNQMAQTKAQNIMNAPHQVAQMQGNWMNYGAGRQDNSWNQMAQGLGMQNQLGNQYNQAYQNMANIYGGQAAGANQQAQNYYNQGQQGIQSGMQGIGFGMLLNK